MFSHETQKNKKRGTDTNRNLRAKGALDFLLLGYRYGENKLLARQLRHLAVAFSVGLLLFVNSSYLGRAQVPWAHLDRPMYMPLVYRQFTASLQLGHIPTGVRIGPWSTMYSMASCVGRFIVKFR